MLAAAVFFWGLSISNTSLATGFAMLYVARVVLGLAQGPSFPAVAVRCWLPARDRASALTRALAIGARLVSQLIDAFGWRTMFLTLVAPSFCWLPLWLLLYRDRPDLSPHVSKAELAHIQQG